MENSTKAIVVDEDLICLEILSKLFEKFNCKVVPFQSAAEALYALRESEDDEFDLALIEVHVGSTGFTSLNGFKLIEHIHKENKKIPVFTMCAHKEDDKLLVEGLQDKGSYCHISKPLTTEKIEMLHKKVLGEKGKRSEASGDKSLAINEKCDIRKTASKVVHLLSDDEESGRGDQRSKRVRWDPELLSKHLGAVESPRSVTPQNIIMNIVVQGQNYKEVARHPREDQQDDIINGKRSCRGSGSGSKQPFSNFERNIHFHYRDLNRTTSATPHADLPRNPSLSELVNTPTTTAPRDQIQWNLRYTNIGLVLEPSDRLSGLKGQIVTPESGCSSRQKSMAPIAGNEKGPGWDGNGALTGNNLDFHREYAALENLISDVPLRDTIGHDVLGCSGKEQELAGGTDLQEEIKGGFDIGKFDFLFDDSFMD